MDILLWNYSQHQSQELNQTQNLIIKTIIILLGRYDYKLKRL